MTTEEEQSQAGRNWLSTLHESRTNCRNKVADAMVAVPDPNQMLWPVKSRRKMTDAHEAAMQAHVSVIDFADQLLPYQNESGIDDKLWTDDLETVALGEQSLTISLKKLEQWEFQFYENAVTREDELYGEKKEREQYRILLPVKGMRACYRQLNLLTKELGFGAETDIESLPKGGLKTPEP